MSNPNPHDDVPCSSPEWCPQCERQIAWQARLDALEEAAKEVEDGTESGDFYARAIRALKEKP